MCVTSPGSLLGPRPLMFFLRQSPPGTLGGGGYLTGTAAGKQIPSVLVLEMSRWHSCIYYSIPDRVSISSLVPSPPVKHTVEGVVDRGA